MFRRLNDSHNPTNESHQQLAYSSQSLPNRQSGRARPNGRRFRQTAFPAPVVADFARSQVPLRERPFAIRAANVSLPSPLLGRGAGGEGRSQTGLSLQLPLTPDLA